MSDTNVYPNEWARLIGRLTRRPGWNQKLVAEAAGTHPRTVSRWISGESTKISGTSMRLVAEAFGIEYATVAEAALGAQLDDRMKDDEAIQIIREYPGVDDDVKTQLITHLLERREENEAALRREIEILLRTSSKGATRRPRKRAG